ncbi:FAD binding domain-containing protein [Streptomyces albidoflavus]|uniref:FAD binding domain-containing protein n=1 Tax=Streptomyces albidoflavus TaxID=1886 RepID=UPI003454D5B1
MLLLSHGLVAPSQRTIPPFSLSRPATLAEAVTAGSRPGAVYAQGCSDLFAQFREGLRCDTLVSLEHLPELRAVTREGDALRIGAGVAHHDGARDRTVRATLPGLAEGWGRIANERIRRRATLGGNLMARRTRYEMSVMADALDARLDLLTPEGPRTLTAPALWERAEPPGALLTSVTVPDAAGTWFGYDRSMRPLMTAAVAVRGELVRLAVGSEYGRPYAVSTVLGADPAEAAARLPEEIGDVAGGAPYRRHLAGVLLGRLLGRHAAETGREKEKR